MHEQQQHPHQPQQQNQVNKQGSITNAQKQQHSQNMLQCQVVNKAHAPNSIRARNRRYKKLKMLWKQGYFEQQQIMLAFPQLYYDYVGKFKKNGSVRASNTQFQNISQFLQSQIIRSEYRTKLQQIKQGSQILNKQNIDSCIDQQQMQQMNNQQMQPQQKYQHFNNKNYNNKQSSPFEQDLQQLSQIDLELQEQALIDFIQSQFIQGLLPDFDYNKIDADQELDDRKIMDDDQQQEYFNSVSKQQSEQQNVKQRDIQNNTGIQDF